MKQGIGRALLFSLTVLTLFGTCSALSACYGDTAKISFTFTNSKDTVQHYSIQKSGVPASWTDVSPLIFPPLYPGKSQSVVAFIRVPFGVREGVYPLTITAKSDEGDSITQVEDVFVSSCHALSITADKSSFDACINDDFIIQLLVKNNGKYLENINLSSSYGVLSQSSLVLPLNDSQVVNLIVRSSDLNAVPVSVTAVSENSVETVSFSVNFADCVSFTASLSNPYVDLCENEEADVMLNIKGNGGLFYLNVSSPFFIDVPSSVQASSGSYSRSFRVYSGCESGVFNPGLKVWTEGSSVVDVPLVLNLHGCFQPIVVSDVRNDEVCACESVSYGFDVFNPGSKAVTYALSSSYGSVFVDGVQVSSVLVPADGKVRAIVNYTIPCDFSGVFNASLTATAVHECVKSFSDVVSIKVNSWSACETVNVDAPALVAVNDSQFTVPVRVSNVGLRNASYSLMVSGSAANNLLGISKSFVTLEPGASEFIDLVFSPENITGAFITVEAFSTDNLASSSKVINFGSSDYSDLYYVLIPAGVTVLLALVLARGKVFKKSKAQVKVNGEEEKLESKPEVKSGKSRK